MRAKRIGGIVLSALALAVTVGQAGQAGAVSVPGWAARGQFQSDVGCLVYQSDNSVRNVCSSAGVDFILPANAGAKTIVISGLVQLALDTISCSAFVASQTGSLISANQVNFHGGTVSVTGTVPTNGTLLLRCTLPGQGIIRSVNWNM